MLDRSVPSDLRGSRQRIRGREEACSLLDVRCWRLPMKLHGRPAVGPLACLITVCALPGCQITSSPDPYDDRVPVDVPSVPECDPTLVVAPESRALMVTEPEALAGLDLEGVLATLLDRFGDSTTR